jgi:choline kinase
MLMDILKEAVKMEAVILAGGRGSRMGKLTESTPKSMIPVGGKPIIEHMILNASDVGIDRFLINTGYLGDKIKDYFDRDYWHGGHNLRNRILYFESSEKGPENALFEARKYLSGNDFCCLCGDNILLPWQIELLINLNRARGADATFCEENGTAYDIKRIKSKPVAGGGKITGASRDLQDKMLAYNMCMKKTFLDKLHGKLKDREEKSFALSMDELSHSHNLFVADIGDFINVNYAEDISNAELMLRTRVDKDKHIYHILDMCDFESDVVLQKMYYTTANFAVSRSLEHKLYTTIPNDECSCSYATNACNYRGRLLTIEPYTEIRAKKLGVSNE